MIRTIIIDDEPAALDRYAGYVEDYGPPFRVVAQCRCAAEAYEAAARLSPDVVMTDIRMPGEDGLSVLAHLRDSGWKGLSVVISGHDDFGYAQKAIRLRVFDYLLKPIFPEDMRRILDKVASLPAGAMGRPVQDPVRSAILPDGLADLPAPVRKAIDFIDLRYDSHFSIEEAAAAAFVSTAWLSASFKRSVGMSVMEYTRRRRAESARELLSGTDAPLKEIAEALAFPDLPTFSKLFRKVMGTSPGAYRKGLRSVRRST